MKRRKLGTVHCPQIHRNPQTRIFRQISANWKIFRKPPKLRTVLAAKAPSIFVEPSEFLCVTLGGVCGLRREVPNLDRPDSLAVTTRTSLPEFFET